MFYMKRAYLIELNIMDLLLTSPNFRFGENKNTWKFPVFTKYKDTLFFFEANCTE